MVNSQKLTWTNKLLLIVLSVGTLWGIAATALLVRQSNQNTSSPQITDPLKIDSVIIPSQCPRTALVSEGPTWHDITIGVSSSAPISELYGIQFSFQQPPIWVNEGFADSYSVLLTRDRAEELGLPMGISFCVVNNKILALTMDLPQDASFPQGNIAEWITQYGEPEIITWKEGTSDWCNRILAWPKSGVAAEFNVTTLSSSPEFVRANTITLLPYVVGEDYHNQWPYNDFLDNKSPSGNNTDNCPTEQNPFNFDES